MMRFWVRLNAIRGDETCQRLRMHNAEAALIQSLMTLTSNSKRTVVTTMMLTLMMMSFGIRCSDRL